MRPTFHPEGLFDESKVSSNAGEKKKSSDISQLWHLSGRCPEDTIPIRRTKGDDILRASSVKRYGRKKHRAIPQPRSADPDLATESGHQVHHNNCCKKVKKKWKIGYAFHMDTHTPIPLVL